MSENYGESLMVAKITEPLKTIAKRIQEKIALQK